MEYEELIAYFEMYNKRIYIAPITLTMIISWSIIIIFQNTIYSTIGVVVFVGAIASFFINAYKKVHRDKRVFDIEYIELKDAERMKDLEKLVAKSKHCGISVPYSIIATFLSLILGMMFISVLCLTDTESSIFKATLAYIEDFGEYNLDGLISTLLVFAIGLIFILILLLTYIFFLALKNVEIGIAIEMIERKLLNINNLDYEELCVARRLL